MLFSSITFLYYFLPVTLLLHVLAPEKWKNGVLLAASLLFYFWGEPKYGLLIVLLAGAGYTGGRVLEKRPGFRAGAAVFITIPLLFLLVFKYADFGIAGVRAVTGLDIPILGLALPVGLSFYTFQIISYLVDVYRGDIPAEASFWRFAVYVTLFPQLIAGPIVRYSSIAAELLHRRTDWDSVSEGGARFACGLGKKVLIADVLSELVEKLDRFPELGTAAAWMQAAAFTLQIYYDFSGYSDMAIGLGKMFGFTFPENFLHPLAAESVTGFWRRWHVTLGSWFRDYVYIPLGGNRVPPARWIVNTIAVWMLSGLWHGAGWNFAVWGLYFSVFLIVEKAARGLARRGNDLRNYEKASPEKMYGKREAAGPEKMYGKHEAASPEKKCGNRAGVCRGRNMILGAVKAGAGHIYTLAVVLVSFVIFRHEQLSDAWENIRQMFSFQGAGAGASVISYEIKSYGFLLLAAAVGALPWMRRLTAFVDRKCGSAGWRTVICPFVTLLLLLVSTAFLIGGSAHPFLYFRF